MVEGCPIQAHRPSCAKQGVTSLLVLHTLTPGMALPRSLGRVVKKTKGACYCAKPGPPGTEEPGLCGVASREPGGGRQRAELEGSQTGHGGNWLKVWGPVLHLPGRAQFVHLNARPCTQVCAHHTLAPKPELPSAFPKYLLNNCTDAHPFPNFQRINRMSFCPLGAEEGGGGLAGGGRVCLGVMAAGLFGSVGLNWGTGGDHPLGRP